MVTGENVDQRLDAWKSLKRCGENTFFCCEWVSAKVQEGGRGGRSFSFSRVSGCLGEAANFPALGKSLHCTYPTDRHGKRVVDCGRPLLHAQHIARSALSPAV